MEVMHQRENYVKDRQMVTVDVCRLQGRNRNKADIPYTPRNKFSELFNHRS